MNEPIALKDVACLNGWPEGTNGHDWEQKAMQTLIALGQQLGYGRLAQLAGQINEIATTPEGAKKYRRRKSPDRRKTLRPLEIDRRGDGLDIRI